MKIGSSEFSWWPSIRRFTSVLLGEIDKVNDGWGWKATVMILVSAVWVVGVVAITLAFIFIDAIYCTLSSFQAVRASVYWLMIGVGLLFLFPEVNVDYLYGKIKEEHTAPPGPTDCLKEYKINRYATAPNHTKTIKDKLEKMGFMDSTEKIQEYIDRHAKGPYPCHVTGEMVWKHSQKHNVDVRLMLALMHVDSHFGTAANKDGSPSKAVRTKNPGNVGNDDSGKLVHHSSWDSGVEAVAKWLKRNRKIIVSSLRESERAVPKGTALFVSF